MRPVEVTHHAVDQFRERFPEEMASGSYLRLLVAQEVNEALDSGRYSTRQPSWAVSSRNRVRGRRNGNERDRTMRFVWTADLKRMYLVDKHGGLVRVITSIRPEGDTHSA
jgi:hypothetical protein